MISGVTGGVVAALLMGVAPVSAQIGVGPLGGVSFANFHGSDKDILGLSRSGRTGFLVGVMLDIPLGAVSIRPEAFYVQKGVRYSDSSGEVGFNFDYIQLPVLLVVGIPTGGLRIELFGGPQVAFQTKCELPVTPTGGSTITVECDDPILQAGNPQKTDFGILVGGGVVVGSFMAQAAFDYGLRSIGGTDNAPDVKNQAFYILVGWMFRLN